MNNDFHFKISFNNFKHSKEEIHKVNYTQHD